MTHVDGEEEDDMPPTNLSKLVCLKSEGEKVSSASKQSKVRKY